MVKKRLRSAGLNDMAFFSSLSSRGKRGGLTVPRGLYTGGARQQTGGGSNLGGSVMKSVRVIGDGVINALLKVRKAIKVKTKAKTLKCRSRRKTSNRMTLRKKPKLRIKLKQRQ